jgi:hypothetical protein
MMDQLRTLGIIKGQPFAPDGVTQAALGRAVERAHAGFIRQSSAVVPFWPGTHWGLARAAEAAIETRFAFETPGSFDLDSRAAFFFVAYAPPARLGEASFYLGAFHDARGRALAGERRYRLHVPPDVPAEQFWSVTSSPSADAQFSFDARASRASSS